MGGSEERKLEVLPPYSNKAFFFVDSSMDFCLSSFFFFCVLVWVGERERERERDPVCGRLWVSGICFKVILPRAQDCFFAGGKLSDINHACFVFPLRFPWMWC
jgi:hypothetical protein